MGGTFRPHCESGTCGKRSGERKEDDFEKASDSSISLPEAHQARQKQLPRAQIAWKSSTRLEGLGRAAHPHWLGAALAGVRDMACGDLHSGSSSLSSWSSSAQHIPQNASPGRRVAERFVKHTMAIPLSHTHHVSLPSFIRVIYELCYIPDLFLRFLDTRVTSDLFLDVSKLWHTWENKLS